MKWYKANRAAQSAYRKKYTEDHQDEMREYRRNRFVARRKQFKEKLTALQQLPEGEQAAYVQTIREWWGGTSTFWLDAELERLGFPALD